MDKIDKRVKKKRGPPKGTNVGGNGRKEHIIEWSKVDKMLEAGCTGTEIAGEIGCHPDTLYDRCEKEKGLLFSVYVRSKRAKGDGTLRAKQFKLAMEGDRVMLIWLGKNRLGQKENPFKTEEFNGKLGDLLDMLKKVKDKDEFDNKS